MRENLRDQLLVLDAGTDHKVAAQIDHVTLEDWEGFAEECGFTKAFVRRRVRQLAESVEGVTRQVAKGL